MGYEWMTPELLDEVCGKLGTNLDLLVRAAYVTANSAGFDRSLRRCVAAAPSGVSPDKIAKMALIGGIQIGIQMALHRKDVM